MKNKINYYYQPETNTIVPLIKTSAPGKTARTYTLLNEKLKPTKTRYEVSNNHVSLKSKYNLHKIG